MNFLFDNLFSFFFFFFFCCKYYDKFSTKYYLENILPSSNLISIFFISENAFSGAKINILVNSL